MSSIEIDFNEIAERARVILNDCSLDNTRVGSLFQTNIGFDLILDSLKKVGELASKKVKNVRKSQEFAIWFSNEYESKTGYPAPDKIINLVREVCVNLLTKFKRLFFRLDEQ